MAVSSGVVSPRSGLAFRGTLSWVWTVLRPVPGAGADHGALRVADPCQRQLHDVASWQTIAVQTVVVGTAALGMTAIMISGGIDLSVGSTVALVTVGIAMLVKWLPATAPRGASVRREVLLPAAMMLGIFLGGLCGAINGLLISSLRVVPFIVTLGSYKVFRGLAKWLSSNPVGLHARRRQELVVQSDPGDGAAAGLAAAWPRGVWILLVLSLILAVTLRYTLLGRVRLRDRVERGDGAALRDQRA